MQAVQHGFNAGFGKVEETMSRVVVGRQLRCGCITYAVTIESLTSGDLREMQAQGLVIDVVEGQVVAQSCPHRVGRKEVKP